MSNLFLALLKALVAAMQEILVPENVRKVIDKAFDYVEDKVKDSPTSWDDTVVLPILTALRKALNVPDDDEQKAQSF
jgi:uncharacterized protein (UPF0147 family)